MHSDPFQLYNKLFKCRSPIPQFNGYFCILQSVPHISFLFPYQVAIWNPPCHLKVSSSQAKIDENLAYYFFKTEANNKCFILLKCTCEGLQKIIIELGRQNQSQRRFDTSKLTLSLKSMRFYKQAESMGTLWKPKSLYSRGGGEAGMGLIHFPLIVPWSHSFFILTYLCFIFLLESFFFL